jgi:hypothetical protein
MPENSESVTSPERDLSDTTCSTDSQAEYWRWCPRCSHELHNHKCKLLCPWCGYFMSCSDFD